MNRRVLFVSLLVLGTLAGCGKTDDSAPQAPPPAAPAPLGQASGESCSQDCGGGKVAAIQCAEGETPVCDCAKTPNAVCKVPPAPAKR